MCLSFNSRTHKYTVSENLLQDNTAGNVDQEPFQVPSVTGICGVIDKSAPLIGWALNKAMAVCKGAIQPNTPYEEIFLDQIWESAKRAHREVKQEAADIGTQAHRAIEECLRYHVGALCAEPQMSLSDLLYARGDSEGQTEVQNCLRAAGPMVLGL